MSNLIKIHEYYSGAGKDYPRLINPDRIEDVEILDYDDAEYTNVSLARVTLFNGQWIDIGAEDFAIVCEAVGHKAEAMRAN